MPFQTVDTGKGNDRTTGSGRGDKPGEKPGGVDRGGVRPDGRTEAEVAYANAQENLARWMNPNGVTGGAPGEQKAPTNTKAPPQNARVANGQMPQGKGGQPQYMGPPMGMGMGMYPWMGGPPLDIQPFNPANAHMGMVGSSGGKGGPGQGMSGAITLNDLLAGTGISSGPDTGGAPNTGGNFLFSPYMGGGGMGMNPYMGGMNPWGLSTGSMFNSNPYGSSWMNTVPWWGGG